MIVVFGSLNVDVVMQVERLPRPGETVLGDRYFLVQGGKGANQACAAARASCESGRVAMFGQIGRDAWGDFAIALLEQAKVDLSGVGRSDLGTGCAMICVDSDGQNAISVARGANLDARASQVPDALLGAETWLVLQMEVPVGENWALIERAKRAGAHVLLNVAPAAAIPAASLAAVDVLVVNEIEARMVAGVADIAADEPAGIAHALAEHHGLACIVTLGKAGAVAVSPQGAWSIETLPVTPVDTTGAGDSFVGCLAAAIDAGAALPDALRFASVGAGLSCTVAGAQPSFASHAQISARATDIAPAQTLDA